MTCHHYKLQNGLQVIIVPIQEVGSVTTMVMVGAGSRYEEKSNNGISHFLEHMAFKGTKKRPTAMEIASLIDGIGAESNAFTSKEITGYFIKSSYNHIELACDILSDMLESLKLDAAEIDKERGVILEEINLYEDTPARKIGDIFERLLYDDTPMGWDISGEKDIIKTIQREHFLSYLKKFYSASNMTLVIAGKVDLKNAKKLAEKYFSALPSYTIESFAKVIEHQVEPEVFIKQKKTEQTHFAIGVRATGLKDEKDRYPLSILSAILGGGMSSRLFSEIREKRGLAYYVRTFSEHYVDCGYLATFAGVDSKRIEEAIKVVVDEYGKVAKNDITSSELKKAKQYIKGHFILELEDTKSVAAYYATQLILERKLEDPEEVIEKIERVSLADIHRVSKKYLKTDSLNLAIIGDFDSSNSGKERFLKLLT